jgi:hypothetical protein
MLRTTLLAVAALGLCRADDGPTCAAHGTAVDFHDSPALAAKAAKKDGKLVLVLHVSGHFEDPRFT